jgi:hypothetical protein
VVFDEFVKSITPANPPEIRKEARKTIAVQNFW